LVHPTENPSSGKNPPLQQDMLKIKLTKWGIQKNPGALICKQACEVHRMELSGFNYENQKRHASSKFFLLNSYTYVKMPGLRHTASFQ
jgi:hypothetical protein